MSTNTDPEVQEINPELPAPQISGTEVAPTLPEIPSEKQFSQQLEQGQQSTGATAQQNPFPQDQSQTAAATPTDPASATAADPSQAQASVPQIADDTDLIEKEWVEKAKYIVERTKTDPRVRNREMNKLKAEYLKKRYNRELKLDDSE